MLLNEESRIQITFYGLGFPNCVSAIFHFSLFTIHFSLFIKRRKLTRLWLIRHFQNLSRITLMRRICSFTDFLLCCWISLRLRGAGIVTDYLLQEESCAVQAQIQSERNPLQYTRPNKRNPWKDKIRRIGVIRELFERVRTEPKAKEHNNVVLSSRQLSSP